MQVMRRGYSACSRAEQPPLAPSSLSTLRQSVCVLHSALFSRVSRRRDRPTACLPPSPASGVVGSALCFFFFFFPCLFVLPERLSGEAGVASARRPCVFSVVVRSLSRDQGTNGNQERVSIRPPSVPLRDAWHGWMATPLFHRLQLCKIPSNQRAKHGTSSSCVISRKPTQCTKFTTWPLGSPSSFMRAGICLCHVEGSRESPGNRHSQSRAYAGAKHGIQR